jgi:hypothetical protein
MFAPGSLDPSRARIKDTPRNLGACTSLVLASRTDAGTLKLTLGAKLLQTVSLGLSIAAAPTCY